MMLGSVNLFVNGYFSVPALLIIQILNVCDPRAMVLGEKRGPAGLCSPRLS
jgi:hypothetical protein